MCGPCSVSSRECLYASAPSTAGRGARSRPASSTTSKSPSQAPKEPALNAVSSPEQPLSLPGVASLVSEPLFRPGHPSPSDTVSPGRRRPATAQPGASPGAAAAAGSHLAQAIQRLDDGHHIQYVYSPDTVASELLTADLASTRWFDLLATDAAQADAGFILAPSRPQTRPPSPSAEQRNAAALQASQSGLPGTVSSAQTGQEPTGSISQIVSQDCPDTSLERREWQLEDDICLRNEEVALFRTFTERAALWLDLFDPCRHFSTYATRLAVSDADFLAHV